MDAGTSSPVQRRSVHVSHRNSHQKKARAARAPKKDTALCTHLPDTIRSQICLAALSADHWTVQRGQRGDTPVRVRGGSTLRVRVRSWVFDNVVSLHPPPGHDTVADLPRRALSGPLDGTARSARRHAGTRAWRIHLTCLVLVRSWVFDNVVSRCPAVRTTNSVDSGERTGWLGTARCSLAWTCCRRLRLFLSE